MVRKRIVLLVLVAGWFPGGDAARAQTLAGSGTTESSTYPPAGSGYEGASGGRGPLTSGKDVVRFVQRYIRESSREEGFVVENRKTGDRLLLDLVTLHESDHRRLADGGLAVAGEFVSSEGVRYDLDFVVDGSTVGTLRIRNLWIHRIGGTERYHWARDREGTWERQPVSRRTPVKRRESRSGSDSSEYPRAGS